MNAFSYVNGSQFHVVVLMTFFMILILSRVPNIDSDQLLGYSTDLSSIDVGFPMTIEAIKETTVPSHWQCGSSPLELTAAYHWVSTVSADVIEEINSCCVVHDGDYDMCSDRSAVDLKFDQCLTNACNKSESWSYSKDSCVHFVATIFSQLVQVYGEEAHKRACDVKEASNSSTKAAASSEPVSALYGGDSVVASH